MTEATTNGTKPLAPAPTDVEPVKSAAPLNYRAEFLVETAEGFHVLLAGEQLTPRDAMVWMKSASAELAKQGFKPVRRDLQLNVQQAPAATGQGTATRNAGEAVEIPAEDGKPPRCSLHGAMEFKEGTIAQGKPRAGEAYAFWACKVRGCRPKKA